MAKTNTCDCPTPPGGRAVCESHQLAICKVQHGVAITMCMDPPQHQYGRQLRGIELDNWVLEEITGTPRSLATPLSSADRQILDSGEYDDRSRGLVITFSYRRPESRGTPSGMAAPPAMGA